MRLILGFCPIDCLIITNLQRKGINQPNSLLLGGPHAQQKQKKDSCVLSSCTVKLNPYVGSMEKKQYRIELCNKFLHEMMKKFVNYWLPFNVCGWIQKLHLLRARISAVKYLCPGFISLTEDESLVFFSNIRPSVRFLLHMYANSITLKGQTPKGFPHKGRCTFSAGTPQC